MFDKKLRINALVDRCPHKSAVLSEGRVTSCSNFQCAYHGWSFDGRDGTCVKIPQIGLPKSLENGVGGARAKGFAIPAVVSQGMVCLFPGGVDKSFMALPSPSDPEMDDPNYKYAPVVIIHNIFKEISIGYL